MAEYERSQYPKTFNLLILLTDGAIHDLEETKQMIVELSYKPVSIVIFGIGDADFSSMSTLDADSDVLVDQYGRPAARDIVQFVQFSDLTEMAQVEVEELMLEEIPDQFVDYMVMHQEVPGSIDDIEEDEDIGFANVFMRQAMMDT